MLFSRFFLRSALCIIPMEQTRRNNHKLIKFHEMFHKDAPNYLNSLVPPRISETHQHNTRRSNNTVHLNCRTFYYQNSFLPASIKLWNNMPNDIRLNSSKSCFKRFLNRNLGKQSYYFNFGSQKDRANYFRAPTSQM